MDKVLMQKELNKNMVAKAITLQNLLWTKYKLKILFTQGFRTLAYQQQLYNQGRIDKTKPVVTNCKPGFSPHNYGLALDFVPLVNGKADYKNLKNFDIVGIEAEKLGFKWGGHFKSFVDRPHIEMLYGLTIADLRNGKRPSIK